MSATAEEIEALNLLRSMQRRPPLAAHEVEGLAHEEPRAGPTALPPPSAEEQQALAYVRQLQRREVAEGRPAASGIRLPNPARIVGGVLDRARRTVGASAQGGTQDMGEDAALAAGGYPGELTAKERATLAEMAAEYLADGDPPMTSAKATQLVMTWRRRAA